MAAPAKLNLKIYQGSTFREIFRWESSTKGYVPIVGISKTAPVVISTQSHLIPAGWRVNITGVGGMKEINNSDVYHIASEVTENSITINAVNATQYSTYTSGGTIEYNVPVDLTGFNGRMQIRSEVDSDIVLAELTTENGGFEIDLTYKTIMIEMLPHDTALLDFDSAVYSIELVRGGEVVPFAYGIVSLVKEVTR